ncbi:MAG: hypothetical protein OXT09_16390, partial [Myxococcales bacterium]|nr:hypothetical protein [Myxococcales bacterium]
MTRIAEITLTLILSLLLTTIGCGDGSSSEGGLLSDSQGDSPSGGDGDGDGAGDDLAPGGESGANNVAQAPGATPGSAQRGPAAMGDATTADDAGGLTTEPDANTNVALGGGADFGFFRNLLEQGIVPSTEDFDAAGFFAEHHTALPEPDCGE